MLLGLFPAVPKPLFSLLASSQWKQLFGCCLDTALVCQMAASQGRHPVIAQCKKHYSLENIWIKSLWSEHIGFTAALAQIKVIAQSTQEDLTKKKKNFNVVLYFENVDLLIYTVVTRQPKVCNCLWLKTLRHGHTKDKTCYMSLWTQYKPWESKSEVMGIFINQKVFHNKTLLVCGRPKNRRKR